ncbi:hypothetical protein A2911_00590 [Candidatus Nomurabacteria bacterium RIFCSPLOWO2_01_FULL_40_15]|uniref:Uncharacterized protein n=1 Tax=Candidatus Nomurabacteria bacterium RIFCSPLOWO2_01_FULL_40_15 TaxID=1801772 RepID=A0A1F6X8C7_9BACT|nr:MAG: hypothetical protein A2911_00590 [Candidatus Nomurabacteria bacterium RIFCSPLOWO2_01_FULL_40_15]
MKFNQESSGPKGGGEMKKVRPGQCNTHGETVFLDEDCIKCIDEKDPSVVDVVPEPPTPEPSHSKRIDTEGWVDYGSRAAGDK